MKLVIARFTLNGRRGNFRLFGFRFSTRGKKGFSTKTLFDVCTIDAVINSREPLLKGKGSVQMTSLYYFRVSVTYGIRTTSYREILYFNDNDKRGDRVFI